VPTLAQKYLVGVFAVTAGDPHQLAEQLAPGLPVCHPRIPAAHLFGVFFDACFTHFHGWRHGIRFNEATRLHFHSFGGVAIYGLYAE
jgi:hypothetical protein